MQVLYPVYGDMGGPPRQLIACVCRVGGTARFPPSGAIFLLLVMIKSSAADPSVAPD
jgi:hypothetical protein